MANFEFGEPETSPGIGGTANGDSDPSRDLGAVNLGGDTGGGDNRDGGDDTVFDPERHLGRDRVNADGTYRRKRRRKGSGSGNSRASNQPKTRADLKASVDNLSGILLVVHAGLASVLKTPEIEIEETESKALAGSLTAVLNEFDIPVDPKIAAVIGLMFTAGSIYGPHFYLYRERMKEERAQNVKDLEGYS